MFFFYFAFGATVQIYMCLFVCAASAVAIDSTEKKQEKRGVLGVGLAGGLVAPPLGLAHSGLVAPAGYVAPAGIVGSTYGGYGLPHGPILGSSYGLGLPHAPIVGPSYGLGLPHAPIVGSSYGLGLSHGLPLAHAPITTSYGLGAPLGLAHSSYVGAPLGLGHTSLGLSHGLYGGSTYIH